MNMFFFDYANADTPKIRKIYFVPQFSSWSRCPLDISG